MFVVLVFGEIFIVVFDGVVLKNGFLIFVCDFFDVVVIVVFVEVFWCFKFDYFVCVCCVEYILLFVYCFVMIVDGCIDVMLVYLYLYDWDLVVVEFIL